MNAINHNLPENFPFCSTSKNKLLLGFESSGYSLSNSLPENSHRTSFIIGANRGYDDQRWINDNQLSVFIMYYGIIYHFSNICLIKFFSFIPSRFSEMIYENSGMKSLERHERTTMYSRAGEMKSLNSTRKVINFERYMGSI